MSFTIHLVEFTPETSVNEQSITELHERFLQNGPAVLRTYVTDPNHVQIWSSNPIPATTLPTLGRPSISIQVNGDPFARPDHILLAPVVEIVQNWFPLDVDRAKIEADFYRFDEPYLISAKGEVGCIIGWSENEHSHPDLNGGEKAICFFVIRGWDDMASFQVSMETEEFKKNIPILFAWGAPHKMWHTVKRSVVEQLSWATLSASRKVS